MRQALVGVLGRLGEGEQARLEQLLVEHGEDLVAEVAADVREGMRRRHARITLEWLEERVQTAAADRSLRTLMRRRRGTAATAEPDGELEVAVTGIAEAQATAAPWLQAPLAQALADYRRAADQPDRPDLAEQADARWAAALTGAAELHAGEQLAELVEQASAGVDDELARETALHMLAQRYGVPSQSWRSGGRR